MADDARSRGRDFAGSPSPSEVAPEGRRARTGTARAYYCSNCGGPNEEGARSCPYCRCPIATVRCGACHHMNVPEALHCSGCGHPLGLEPIYHQADLVCTRCAAKLLCLRANGGHLFDCPSCGGQFVEHALLRELLERREVTGTHLPQHPRRENPLAQPVVYLKCPRCQQVMNRKNFGASSGIIVDVCSAHGFWFDSGELPLVLKFVEQGGLARARHMLASNTRSPLAPATPFEIYQPKRDLPDDDADDVVSAIARVGLGLLKLLSRA